MGSYALIVGLLKAHLRFLKALTLGGMASDTPVVPIKTISRSNGFTRAG
jgi:hypothetical protein